MEFSSSNPLAKLKLINTAVNSLPIEKNAEIKPRKVNLNLF